MKKLLAIFTSILLLYAMIPLGSIPVSAATSGTTGDCTWTLDGTQLTISGNGKMGNYASWNNNPTPWGADITSVTIEEGVTAIGEYAFSQCTSLTTVTIPDSVTVIGGHAFSFCESLTNLTMGNGVVQIRTSAFYCCYMLPEIAIPDSVTTIDQYAFKACKTITSLTIPDSVKSIGDYAFDCCFALQSLTIGDGVTSIGVGVFFDCYALETVVIGDGLVTLGRNAFRNCERLRSVTIPDSVTSIGDSAFSNCNSLTSVSIGDSVTTIGESAFSNCDSLTSVTIGDSVATIGWNAFGDCDSLSDVYYGGTEADKANITISSSNDPLLNATWHYNYVPVCDHIYDNDDDATCNECGAVRQIAAQILSGGEVSISEDVNGLAFLFNATIANAQETDADGYVSGSATVIPLVGGESYPVLRMGAVVSNAADADMTLEGVDNQHTIQIEAKRLWDVAEDSVSFAIRLINIPEYGKDTLVTARPYYVYEVDGEEIVVYGDAVSKTYNEAQ